MRFDPASSCFHLGIKMVRDRFDKEGGVVRLDVW